MTADSLCGAHTVQASAKGAADPARALVSLCAQVLVNLGAKRRKIHHDLTVLLVGNPWAPYLACWTYIHVPSCACCLCFIWQGILALGKLVMEELYLLGRGQVNAPIHFLETFPDSFDTF